MRRIGIAAFFHGVFLAALFAQPNNGRFRHFETSEFDAGPARTAMSTSGFVNPDSTLKRRGFVINDDSCPIRLNGVAPKTVYDPQRGFRFLSSGEVLFSLSTSAFEIKTVLLDPFGESLQTVSLTDISDKQVGARMTLDAHSEWLGSDHDVKAYVSSVSFVASVLTEEGRVWRFDSKAILAEAQKIRLRITPEDLTPPKGLIIPPPQAGTNAQ